MIKTDVIIVGGGPAGSACAWRLKQNGVKCLILDKAQFPRVKPCAGWLTPGVFKALAVSPADYPYEIIEFSSFNISLWGKQLRLRTHQFGIRRVEFDQWMLDRANVDVFHHKAAQIEPRNKGYEIDGQFFATYLVGAGGTHCPVRRSFFARSPSQTSRGLIITREEEFPYAYTDDSVHIWFFEDRLPGYAWYFPKKNGILNVGIGASAAKLKAKGATLNEHWDKLIRKLNNSGLVTGHDYNPLGYSYYLNQNSALPRSGNALLVGDALGVATRDMGEGIHPSITTGLLAADSISSGKTYDPSKIHKYSLPALIGLR